MKSTIRLFKALPVSKPGKNNDVLHGTLVKTVSRGFIFSPEVLHNYTNYDELIKLVEEEIGLTKEQMNNMFHKSWKKIREASDEQLMIEQLVHYITTYGFKSLGIYDDSTIFIPKEKLNIPELNDDIKLVVIQGLTKEQLKEKLIELLSTGIALKDDTLRDVIDVAQYVGIDEKDLENIKNKEANIILSDSLGIVPENPVEFLRFLVYQATEKTLLIKNASVINEIKERNNDNLVKYFNQYESKHTLANLAMIFNRFKPIFLAFKTNTKLKNYVNRIRKLSNKHHKPMPGDLLNDITSMIQRNVKIDVEALQKSLKIVNTFRKIRLAYALKYRMEKPTSIMYKIRNGKGYAKEFESKNISESALIFNIVIDSIAKDISKNVKGKKIFIPSYMKYALPSTEKQFTGEFPSGTCVKLDNNIIMGIHWTNLPDYGVDLDLSTIDISGKKVGWDAVYRSDSRNILFSGDITNAPNGATEAFYLDNSDENISVVMLNYFNYIEDHPVPFKIFVANEKIEDFGKNYMVNPNNVKAITKTKIETKQKVLGLLVSNGYECKFYFSEVSIGNSISARSNDHAKHTISYLRDFYTNTINFNDILEKAGATLVDDEKACDINLSPESIDKNSIIKLIS